MTATLDERLQSHLDQESLFALVRRERFARDQRRFDGVVGDHLDVARGARRDRLEDLTGRRAPSGTPGHLASALLVVSYVFLRALQGRSREIHPLMWVVAAAFVLFFGVGVIEQVVGV